MKSYLTSFSGWLKEHLLGMTIFAIITGVLGNFAFEAAKKGIDFFAPPVQTTVLKPQETQVQSTKIETVTPSSLNLTSDNQVFETTEPTTKKSALASEKPNRIEQPLEKQISIVTNKEIAKVEPIANPVTSVKNSDLIVQVNSECPSGQVLRAYTQGGLSRGEGKCETTNCVNGIDTEMTQRMVALGVQNPDGSPVRVACVR